MCVNFFRSGGSIFSLALIILMAAGCRVDIPVVPEPVKDINGDWKIVQVIRNRVDITQKVKLDDFRLEFQSDPSGQNGGTGTYKITRGAPFVVNGDGSWKLNDPVYPFVLSFSPASDPAENVDLNFSFLIIKGAYQIKLVLKPGCQSNTYEYYLGKAK